MPSAEIQTFFTWFQSNKGGRGAVALIDIPENHTLFSIPRSLILTTRTSELPPKFGAASWNKFGLHQGWSGLILCLMWEATRGSESKWAPYFDIMPTKFDTPMFWNDEDLAELTGTSVVDKLGKDQAEKDYYEKIVPAIQSRPDIFAKEVLATHYSLDLYHMMGTRVLSRSFTLAEEEIDDEEQHETGEREPRAPESHTHEIVPVEDVGNTSLGSAMDVDEPNHGHEHEHEHDQGEEDGSDSDSDSEGAPEVALVPMADILNARYKTDNVKLFHERDSLRMVSTRPIKAGEQIWNTYGDLPNSDLLRGFGHVDYLPLPHAPGEYGNPGDVVELRADVIVHNSASRERRLTREDMTERIDWWLEEGGDDDPTTQLLTSLSLVLLSFTHLLLLTPSEFTKVTSKGKPPKPKPTPHLLRVLLAALDARARAYPTTLEEDEREVEGTSGGLEAMGVNRRHAVVARMGEKRVLRDVRRCVVEILEGVERREREEAEEVERRKQSGSGATTKRPQSKAEKRKADREEGGGRKRRK
ncbi:hypothetical protein CPB84DRAFT_1814817 [Gymnopilus junonius]|uniref:SET domain-containing protein n=1 Tax=Gymnopilus junonius TaxID=109634 RepID=A0A9P5NT67_GYMJU|nr:hypothetical protein CPB84DRAFT_1814817 [Gymnopilus junonius]